jgi:predicted DNA-binding transcriptional regulator AlpA
MPQRIDWTTLPDNALVRQRELLRVVPFSPATLWRRVKDRSFPQPIRLPGRMTAWRLGDVTRWLDAQGSAAPKGRRK